ncbi:MAG: ABC transporter ATP-binding protein [Candidatus Omnitrophota bacterium]
MLLTVKKLTKIFFIEHGLFAEKSKRIEAISDISFQVNEGEVFGIIGESGCGKTTLARIIGRIIAPSQGSLAYSPVIKQPSKDIQLIFQNPQEALNPKMTIGESLVEPLRCNNIKDNSEKIISENLKILGFSDGITNRFPHQFSTGQKQKIVIARALMLKPKLLICDEPTASLDLCMQAHILRLLLELKKRLSLTLLFISHDLNVIKIISDRIMVMYSGIIVEIGPAKMIYENPLHPYSRLLLGHSSDLPQDILSEDNNNPCCRFFERCPDKKQECAHRPIHLVQIHKGHWVACSKVTQRIHEESGYD